MSEVSVWVVFSTEICPLYFLTIPLTMERPSPCPSFSVLEVYFLVKISCINSLVAAGPGFSTLIRKLSLYILSVR